MRRYAEYLDLVRYVQISIHAPIVGCDDNLQLAHWICNRISIHAPIVGCDG